MAMIVTWYIRGTVFLVPVLLVNLAMVPATMLHGGHHLVDLLGGVVVFIGVALATSRLIPHDPGPAYPRA
jgi:membrane-associated phospholipid phosphatase